MPIDAGESPHAASPVPVIRENVVFCLHCRVAREPAFGVGPLRWLVLQRAGRERIGRCVIVERAVAPSAAVREPLAVLDHQINVMLGTWQRWRTGFSGI